MKKVDKKETLEYAVANFFPTLGSVDFRIGNKIYQHVNTVYDKRNSDEAWNTIEVCYDYSAMRYVAFNVSDSKVGNKEISIINRGTKTRIF